MQSECNNEPINIRISDIYLQEQENPSNNVESFDAIHYAALQVVIVASANGVSGFHLTFG